MYSIQLEAARETQIIDFASPSGREDRDKTYVYMKKKKKFQSFKISKICYRCTIAVVTRQHTFFIRTAQKVFH